MRQSVRADMTGIEIGMLTVSRYVGRRGRRTIWECDCQCGGTRRVTRDEVLQAIKRGWAMSCGCATKFLIGLRTASHRKIDTKEYRAWCGMKTRCFNKNELGYHRYGGRGITVFSGWIDSFERFLEDVGQAPTKGHSLDRINNNGNYEPGNVRWATKREQALNRRSNVRVEIDGRTITISEWSKETGVSVSALRRRFASGSSVDLLDARLARGRGANTYRGVHLRGSGRFSAVLWNGSKLVQLGTFDSPEQAHVEWLMAKVSNG